MTVRRVAVALAGAVVLVACHSSGPTTSHVGFDLPATTTTAAPAPPARAEVAPAPSESASSSTDAPSTDPVVAVAGPPRETASPEPLVAGTAPPAAEATEPADRVGLPLRSATFAFSGDTLPHTPVVESARRHGGGAFDFRPMYARIAPLVGGADYAICHLETPVAPDGEELSSAPRYGVPKEIAAGIASGGYDRCSTASNHTWDRGGNGVDATVNALEQAGVSQHGMARSAEEAAIVPVFDVNGIAVSHLSYTWSFNGFRLPANEQWRSNLIDPVRIVGDASAARAAGAQVVIVSLHWGYEGSPTITSYQRDVAHHLMSSGTVDLIVGHHAHVIQPIEQVDGRWVVFGMGNSLSNMPTGALPMAESQDGVLVMVTVTELADGTFSVERPVVHPTWVDRDAGHIIRPVLEDLADPAVPPNVRGGLLDSLSRTENVMGDFIASG